MNTDSAGRHANGHSASRALVLSGGALGIAWEAGPATGFAKSGVVLAELAPR